MNKTNNFTYTMFFKTKYKKKKYSIRQIDFFGTYHFSTSLIQLINIMLEMCGRVKERVFRV